MSGGHREPRMTEAALRGKSQVPSLAPRKKHFFGSAFFNEIRLMASEISLRDVKYASRVKYLLRKC